MAWHHRIWNVLRHGRLSNEIDDELRFHLESSIRANVASGMTPDEARRDALRRFGSPSAVRDRTRDTDLVLLLDDLRQDVGFATRAMRRQPGVPVVVLMTLALGIGAATSIFTVVRSVLLRPLPFSEPDALYVISHTSPGPAWLYPGMSDRGFLAFRDANRTLESIATFAQAQSTLTGAGEATRLVGAAVTADFFRVLGVRAALGRTLGPDDDPPGRESVVVISDALWRGRFGADRRLINTTIALNGTPHRVVGILPAGFTYPAGSTYWIPLTVTVSPNVGYIRPAIGRVRPGVGRAEVQADLDVWVKTLPPDPGRPRDLVAEVLPLHDAIVGDVRLPLLVLGGAVLLVLITVCANVANLLLMRAVARRQEIATRLALGAGRSRIVRQLVTESALLSLAGGCAGAALAIVAGPALMSLVPEGRLPSDMPIRVDGWVLAFTAGLATLTGVAVGLAPIAQTTRDAQYRALREGTASATRRSHRMRHALVVAQIALTLMLVIGAGLLVRSFMGLRSVDLGFAPDRVMTMTVDLPVTAYPTATDANRFHRELLQSLAALPGVQAAGAVNWMPLGEMAIRGDIQAADRGDRAGKYVAMKVAISPGYFRTIGIRLLRGRAFTDHDGPGSQPVLIVSESVARRLWPGDDPLGKRMTLEDRPAPQDWLTVVGVVEDVRQRGFADAPAPAVYQPYRQVTRRVFVGYMTFLVRATGDPAPLAPMMRGALHQIDSGEAPQLLASLASIVDRTVAEPKFQARVLAALSVVALFLAALGVYGVLASSVLERRFEIGVRMALGADRSSVIGLVLRRTLALTAAGLTLGLTGALALTGVLEKLLFNVTPTDAATFAIAASVVVTASVLAALLPARRASSIDPLTALRVE